MVSGENLPINFVIYSKHILFHNQLSSDVCGLIMLYVKTFNLLFQRIGSSHVGVCQVGIFQIELFHALVCTE